MKTLYLDSVPSGNPESPHQGAGSCAPARAKQSQQRMIRSPSSGGYKALLRSLVCLALVLCLIINISPVKAKAAEPITLVAIGAASVAAAVLAGLGIQAGVESGIFENIANTFGQWTEGVGLAVDGMVQVALKVTEDGIYIPYVAQNIIELYRSWVYDYAVVVDTSALGTTYRTFTSSPWGAGYLTSNSQTGILYFTWNNINYYLVYSPYDPLGMAAYFYRASGSRIDFTSTNAANGYNYVCGQVPSSGSVAELPFGGIVTGITGTTTTIALGRAFLEKYGGSLPLLESIYTNLDLTLGDIPKATVPLAEGYADWAAGAITLPGSQEEYYPIYIPSASAGVGSLTQPGVQAGGIGADVLDGLLGSGDEAKPGEGDDVLPFVPGSIGATAWDTFTDWITAHWEAILEAIRAIPGAFTEWFEELIGTLKSMYTAFSTWLESIVAGIQSIIEWLSTLPQAIAEAIAQALSWAFVVSDTFVISKVEALVAKYPYMETFNGLGVELKSFFSDLGVKPPQIYIHLGNARGSYNWGGSMLFLDLSWYSEYKPMMDSVLGGFLWLWCGWRTYLSLPGLISGATGVWGAYRSEQERNMREERRQLAGRTRRKDGT